MKIGLFDPPSPLVRKMTSLLLHSLIYWVRFWLTPPPPIQACVLIGRSLTELVLLLNDVMWDWSSSVVLWLCPPECDRLVVEVDDRWLPWLSWWSVGILGQDGVAGEDGLRLALLVNGRHFELIQVAGLQALGSGVAPGGLPKIEKQSKSWTETNVSSKL